MTILDPFGCAQDRLPFSILGLRWCHSEEPEATRNLSLIKISHVVYPEQNQILRGV